MAPVVAATPEPRERSGGDRRGAVLAGLVLLTLLAVPVLLYVVLWSDDSDEVLTTPSTRPTATSAAPADDDDEAAGTTTAAPAARSTTSTASTTTQAPAAAPSAPPAPQIPSADAAAPPVEAFGVYREGKLFLQGSVPTAELAAAYERRAASVIGAENVTNQLTLDPRVQAQTIDIDIDERFTFPEGSIGYDEEFNALLTLGAFALELLPESTLVVTGHTDAIGDEATNLALSTARAALVRDFMVRAGVPPDRVVARGVGEAEPIADNATPEGREANRRIEARLEGIGPG